MDVWSHRVDMRQNTTTEYRISNIGVSLPNIGQDNININPVMIPLTACGYTRADNQNSQIDQYYQSAVDVCRAFAQNQQDRAESEERRGIQ